MIRIKDERHLKHRLNSNANRTTKRRRSRSVPIAPTLYALLKQLPRGKDNLVFHAAKGGVIRENNTLAAFKRHILKPLKKRFPAAEDELGVANGCTPAVYHHGILSQNCLLNPVKLKTLPTR